MPLKLVTRRDEAYHEAWGTNKQRPYVIKGHIRDDRTIVLDEPTSLPLGPALVTVVPIPQPASAAGAYTDEEHAELRAEIRRIGMLDGPPPPAYGLSAKDAGSILYG